jgi:hypothetical protein
MTNENFDKQFFAIRLNDAMVNTGAGSLNKDKTLLKLTLFGWALELIADKNNPTESFTFEVNKKSSVSINGAVSHSIRVVPFDPKVRCRETTYLNTITISNNRGKFTEFRFNLSTEQILRLWRVHSSVILSLSARQDGKNVIVTWEENGRMI